MSFELHPDAEQDLANAIDFYLQEAGPVIAERFLEEFYRVARFLGENPEIVSPASNGHRTFPLHIFPYSVVYRALPGKVRILVVRHQRRRPTFGARRS